MKKYFTKYLPVEGEIKEGDYWKHPKAPNTIFPWTKAYARGPISTGLMQKVKLFLCSRDIQVGDKMTRLDGSKFKADKAPDGSAHWNGHAYKVIGEVSPDATWVKEGMEFDEEEIYRSYTERDYDPEAEEADYYTYKLKGTDPDPKCKDSWHFNPIRIKCSCCGTFK